MNLNTLPYTFIKQASKVGSSCNSTFLVLVHCASLQITELQYLLW